jgi:hypothetical protein
MNNRAKMAIMTQDEPVEIADLAAALAKYDVHYLRTPTATKSLPTDPESLIVNLVKHQSPRAHEALIPLFLRHPEFARYIPSLVQALPHDASLTLRHLYTAAVYLQHLWRGKLEMYFGNVLLLPNYFGESEWGLPNLTVHYGEAGLRVLAEQLQAKTGFNWLDNYHSVMALYLSQLRLKAYD